MLNNLPIVLEDQNTPPAISQNDIGAYLEMVNQMSNGCGAAYNRIRVGKMDFTLVESGVARRVNNGDVVGVCLGTAMYDYCSWYEKTYEPGQEPETPDLVWDWPDRSKFPDALPAQYKQKKNRNGQDRWDFRIARRSIWALANMSPSGQLLLNLDSPYIFDITSASFYGKSDTQMNLYKWSGLIQMCKRFSQPPNFICSPAMFLTRFRIDPTSTVSGVVMFEPIWSKQGSPMYLDSGTFAKILETMRLQTTQEMLITREILDWPKKATAQVNAATPQQVTSQVQAVSAQPIPPVQTATAPTQPSEDAETASRLAQAQAILNTMAASTSTQTGAASAKPAAPVSAATNVNSVTADAIRNFGSIL